MITIFKYVLREGFDTQPIQIPANHEVRHVGLDPQGNMCLWAEINTDEPAVAHSVHVRGTGHPVPDYKALKHGFVGSVVRGPYVWHVWI